MKWKCYILVLLLFVLHNIDAQDVHYAQFQNIPQYTSPALTGVMSADVRVNGVYRSQWNTVPVDYKTFALGFDMKVSDRNIRNGVLALGVNLSRDQAGDSRLSHTQVALNLAYTHQLSNTSFLTAGFGSTFSQRAFDDGNLTFDSQFNGDIYVPGSATGENFDGMNFFYTDFSAGLNYRYQQSRRTVLDAGVSIHHLTEPNQDFFADDNIGLPRRYSPYLNISIQLAGKSDVLLRGIYHNQNAYSETLFGLGWRYHLSERKSREVAFSLSTLYRMGDAVIPMLELEYGSWKTGFSFDINFSEFQVATNNIGGPELTLIYLFTKVKPLGEYKACPLF